MNYVFDDVKEAPRSKRFFSEILVAEIAIGALALALEGETITVAALKRKRPDLAKRYVKKWSCIPTYLGKGLGGLGLNLWVVPYVGKLEHPRTPSFENAALCFRWLNKHKCDLGAIAKELGFADATALAVAIKKLPKHDFVEREMILGRWDPDPA